MTDTVCIIPARGGSTRIPRKNIRPLAGRPIIAYSIENAQRVCTRVIVSTEDAEIAQLARDMGAEVHQRSFEMARNDVGTQEVAKHVLDELRIRRTARVLVLYPCAPLVGAWHLQMALARHHYVVAIGSDPLADAGAFYAGRCADFRDAVPLWNDSTSVIVLPPALVCDVNTADDWERLENKYDMLMHGVKWPTSPVNSNVMCLHTIEEAA